MILLSDEVEDDFDDEEYQRELQETMEILEFDSEEEAEEFIKVKLELEEIDYQEEFGIEDELFEIQIEFE